MSGPFKSSSRHNAYLWLGRAAGAQTCYRRALPLIAQEAARHPSDADLQARLGLAYVRNQERARTFSNARAARALAHQDPRVISAMAEIYESIVERRDAIVWLRKAVAAGQSAENLKNDPILHRNAGRPEFPDEVEWKQERGLRCLIRTSEA
jgi:Flp pilus assembly protein TadD